MSDDFDLYKALWESINNIVAPDPPPSQEPKGCLLLESPGFSINPEYYDYEAFNKTFNEDEPRPSPNYLTAQLCDKVPALSQYFFDTGTRISFKWKQLLSTFWLTYRPDDDKDLRERYLKAVEMLYSDYAGQTKTELFTKIDDLRKNWQTATKEKSDYFKKCKEDGNAGIFESTAGPVIEKAAQALSEYEQMKRQIQNCQAVIYEYTSGDLSVVVEQGLLDMAAHRRYEVGSGGSGSEFYETSLQPGDWYKWFEDGYGENPGDEDGWTSVTVSSKSSHKSTRDTFSKLSVDTTASYLFFSVGAKHSQSKGSSEGTAKENNTTISFKVRKVKINRPWLDLTIIEYPVIGMREVPKLNWSNGSLDPETNKGTFPLLPTAMIVAKDIVISNFEMSEEQRDQYKSAQTDPSASVSYMGITLEGGVSTGSDSKATGSDYDDKSKELRVNGSQIIGWVCTVIPPFPQVEKQLNTSPDAGIDAEK